MKAGLQPTNSPKQWIPFRRQARFKAPGWTEYKPHRVAVFYLVADGSTAAIHFPIDYYLSKVYGFNTDLLDDQLLGLGFYLIGKKGELRADLKSLNSEKVFNSLREVVDSIAVNLDESLSHG